ncbi:Obg family GTPase CgtA [Candidatus Neoehrlichia procyonis]|uniref:GTPase Obg n=1 Tax=Candidatus Neoehrlichia procyonis str. RAC413 TaxID=1359163 RepID=A0A0F3NMF2_9RICK|nr:GTPase ObgE [Candidatus Neoehrlichia lotoris]KJV68887.1 obg family GTPase CgtA [Candidatus Neoehrlichia lotoris str. RAC413]
MNFIDETKVYLKAGNGGSGCSSFRREKFIEFGGPDGGNGGNGGDIILITDSHLNTLLHLKYKQHIKSENGKDGSGNNKYGLSGKHTIIKVPLGTQVYDESGNNLVVDLKDYNQKFIIAKGGKGGIGNSHYKSSTNRAPTYFTYGTHGEEKCILLKLKIISDVGIIGLPNAGKSSFLSRCTNSKTKVANYPFTTLKPHLGVAHINNDKLTLADIPGLIANAHLGAGLGDRFLKHIERCTILLHLIDCTLNDIIDAYRCTNRELKLYNNLLLLKQEFVILNKCDLLNTEEIKKKQEILQNHIKKEVYTLSFNDNINPILNIMHKFIHKKDNNPNSVSTFDPYNTNSYK